MAGDYSQGWEAAMAWLLESLPVWGLMEAFYCRVTLELGLFASTKQAYRMSIQILLGWVTKDH